MAILEILTAPDPFLKKIARPVEKVDDRVRKIMHDMVDTMYHDDGCGLASIQVRVIDRIMVLDMQSSDKFERSKDFYPLFIANPNIITSSNEKSEKTEYCLSVPETGVKVIRSEKIELKYLDYNNQEQLLEADDWLARAIQHELDHLNGKITIDYLSPIKKDSVIRKLVKYKKYQSSPKL